MLSGVLIELNTSVDILMLGYFSTDSTVGIYSFAVKLAEGFGQIPLALRWNVDPIIGKYFAENEIDKISQLSKNIRRVFQPLIGLLGLFAIIIFPFFSTAWLQDNAAIVSAIVFAIVMVGIIINAGYRPFTGILMQGGRPGVNTLLIGGLVLGDALLNLYFIPAFEIYGAALVTSLTYTMEAILLIILSRKLFNVRL
jgi:O-antigen/teichoic acid export membrane protein